MLTLSGRSRGFRFRSNGKHNRNVLIAAGVLIVLASGVRADTADDDQLLATVKSFYRWAMEHGKETAALEPHIQDVKGSTRFALDTSTLDAFAAKFVGSGLFTADFPAAIANYYNHYKAQFEAMSQKEFDEIAKDGRGPLLETEDMDMFFCAQEYEYKPEFIDGMKIKSASITGDTATAVVQSPYQWETEFKFHKADGRWRIAGYCVYK